MSNDTTHDYWATVRVIAEEICAEHPDADDPNGERSDRVHQDVDGSYWVIYTHANLKAIEFSATDPSDTEWHELCDPSKGWGHVTAVVAFCCMEADVNDAIGILDDVRAETA